MIELLVWLKKEGVRQNEIRETPYRHRISVLTERFVTSKKCWPFHVCRKIVFSQFVKCRISADVIDNTDIFSGVLRTIHCVSKLFEPNNYKHISVNLPCVIMCIFERKALKKATESVDNKLSDIFFTLGLWNGLIYR